MLLYLLYMAMAFIFLFAGWSFYKIHIISQEMNNRSEELSYSLYQVISVNDLHGIYREHKIPPKLDLGNILLYASLIDSGLYASNEIYRLHSDVIKHFQKRLSKYSKFYLIACILLPIDMGLIAFFG